MSLPLFLCVEGGVSGWGCDDNATEKANMLVFNPSTVR